MAGSGSGVGTGRGARIWFTARGWRGASRRRGRRGDLDGRPHADVTHAGLDGAEVTLGGSALAHGGVDRLLGLRLGLLL